MSSHLFFLLHFFGEWLSIQSGSFSRQSHHIGTPVPVPVARQKWHLTHTGITSMVYVCVCVCLFRWHSSRKEDVFVGVKKWQDASHSSHQLARWQTVSSLLITVSGTYTRIDEAERDNGVSAIDCPNPQAGPYIYFITRQPVRP